MTTAELDRQLIAEEQIRDRLDDFAGRWIAIGVDGVMADAASLQELLDALESLSEEPGRIMRVAAEKHAVCFF